MKEKTFLTALALAATAGMASAQSFSLDDNPDMPLNSAPFAGLYSAEDPFGLFLPPVPAGLIGPSPSLAGGIGIAFTDGDILKPGTAASPFPVLDVVPPYRSYLNALSADHERFGLEQNEEISIRFSVDRATKGVAGSALESENSFNQQPGDIYQSEKNFPHPGFFAGTLGPGPFAGELPTASAGAVASNTLDIDESDLSLTAGNGPGTLVGPGIPVPPITKGRHDNVDAFNDMPVPFSNLDLNNDLITDTDYFYSIPPAQAALSAAPTSGIYFNASGFGGGPLITYAPPFALGLEMLGTAPNPQLDFIQDDVDALVVWDRGQSNPDQPGPMPGEDFALFSLAPQSASLVALRSAGFPVDGSTIFFTDFTGAFAIYLYGAQVGVADRSFSDNQGGNIDALEVGEANTDKCPGDVNGDGLVTPADFTAWLTCFNDPTSAPFCPCADVNGDGTIDPADFTAWLAAFSAGC